VAGAVTHDGTVGSQHLFPEVQALQLTLSVPLHTYCPQKPQPLPGMWARVVHPPQAFMTQVHEPETQLVPLQRPPLFCQVPPALQLWGCWPLHVA
jgi:hypothetical protein